MFQNNEKITELMKINYPITSEKISSIINSGMYEVDDIVQSFVDDSDINYLKMVSLEMNKSVEFSTFNDKGEPCLISANLMSDFIFQLYAVKKKSANEALITIFRNIESAVVKLRAKLNLLDDIQFLLFNTKNELDVNVAELRSFVEDSRKKYKGYSFHRIVEEKLPEDNPRLKTLIDLIKMYRIVVYTDITKGTTLLTDPATSLDRFIKAYRDVVFLNLQNKIKKISDNSKALDAFDVAEAIYSRNNSESFDLTILKDNYFFMKYSA